ncbi:MAG: c-type cytochrome [Prolixibacteraceae bacterium]|nr:c-type cytochrome [Prolixibacteraceae bacterium]
MKRIFFLALFTTVLIVLLHPSSVSARQFYFAGNIVADPSMVSIDESSNPQDKDKGIGPIKSVELGPLNSKMGNEGKVIYTNQCIICHDIDQNKLGPALKNVTKTRTPEYIMNILLNPVQMQKENATVKALLAKYNNLPMPDPALNQAKARSVLEYLRSLVK